MPPPTSFDPWLSSRRFGVVIDAGSSGSRLQIYSWRDARVAASEGGHAVLNTLPKVEKGTKYGEEWVSKVEPGISTFGQNPEGVAKYLEPLLAHAREHIPPSSIRETPIFLLATAGMRLLSSAEQTDVLAAACTYLRSHSHFKLDAPSKQGPCGSSVRIISGQEEGLFGWIAVNYLMDGFGPKDNSRATYGFLDMGGASTQIAFEPDPREESSDLIDVRLRLLGGQEVHHRVFVTTWLGYGTNQARERYVGKAIDEYELTRKDSKSEKELVPDPCLPKNLSRLETPVHSGPSTPHTRKAHNLVGTGSFTECLEQTAPLLNKHVPCNHYPCLFDGVHVPHIDFSVSRFIGVSEYWYSSEHVFGLGGAYDFVQYERAATDFCGREWTEIVHAHEESRAEGRLGGDGEVVKHGEVVGLGKWGKNVELSRLEMQCFKAAWIVNVLHEGIGMPRIVDPGGNRTAEEGVRAGSKASQKGLGAPTFQSMDTINDTAITWTLGKMVLEASKEVTPLSKTIPPLVDPMNTPQEPAPVIKKPAFIDFEDIEDRIAHRLPKAISRHTLGFSPVAFIFYLLVVGLVLFMAYRFRHRFRAFTRRLVRRSHAKRDERDIIFNAYGAEEARTGIATPYSRPSSPAPVGSPRKLLSSLSGSVRRGLSTLNPHSPNGAASPSGYPAPAPLRRMHSSPGGISPRSATLPSFPSYLSNDGSSNGFIPPIRTSSPDERATTPISANHPNIVSLARSLNANLVPRTASRSGTQTPTGVWSLNDED